MKRGENMGILIKRMPNFNRMKETSDWLDKHPEEIERILNDAVCEDTDSEFDAINYSGANIDYGGRIQKIDAEK